MKKTRLKQYASLIANVGARVQKGQEVMIFAELDQPEFVKMVVDECYKAGAKRVDVEWSYQPLTRLHVRYRSLKTLGTVLDWEVEKLKRRVEVLPVMIYLLSEDPDGLNGINQKKYSKSSQERYKVIKPFRDKMENKYQWCIAAVPGVAWAKKVFPECRKNEAVEKLWEAILLTSRCGDDPVEQWNRHNADLKSRCDYLNSLNIESLHYSSSNGTDFTVGLIEGSQFLGGGEYTLSGNYYNPNIPSEEVFISPKRGEAEGVVYSTMPLSYRGELIENFYIKFENGKAVEAKAEKNEALLNELISMDEGSAYLGECALVPYDSPIRNSGILFYNTLFDENAACHLALGEGFSSSIVGNEEMTLEECREKGINKSIVHEDFMIGSADLDITAKTRDGRTVQIFKNGNWAF
ncbi:MAG: aminopeptidase [Clostridia bacterium]|nr:aminopeptidase [Clostridia bacterium]